MKIENMVIGFIKLVSIKREDGKSNCAGKYQQIDKIIIKMIITKTIWMIYNWLCIFEPIAIGIRRWDIGLGQLENIV